MEWMDQAFGIELSTNNGELRDLTISPNPVSDYLTIDFPSGAVVIERSIRVGDQINVEILPSGIYDIKAMTSDAVFQSRFVRL